VADTDVTDGASASSSAAITTAGVSNAAPQAVYQTERYGNFTYTIPNLTPGASYIVRLHFAEFYWGPQQPGGGGVGSRVFNVTINTIAALTNYDIFQDAGAANKPVVKQFTTTADSTGKIAIVYTTVKDNAKSSGIEVLSP